MRDDARRQSLAGKAITGLPGEIPEQHIGLKVFLEGLAFEERSFERVPERADRIGEHVIEHADANVSVRSAEPRAPSEAPVVARASLRNPSRIAVRSR
jgi:hypothetical protein